MTKRGKAGETKKELLINCINPKTPTELVKWYKSKFKESKGKGLNRHLKELQTGNKTVYTMAKALWKKFKSKSKRLNQRMKPHENDSALLTYEDGKYKTKIDLMVRKYPETILDLDKETIAKNNLFLCPKPTLTSFLLRHKDPRISVFKASYIGNVKDLEKNRAIFGQAIESFANMPKEKEGVMVFIMFDGKIVNSQLFKNEYMIHALNSNKDFKKMKLNEQKNV